jgi:hypothetical protein
MAKIAFTARKDPLLRNPGIGQPRPRRARVEPAVADVPGVAVRLPVPDSAVDGREATRVHEEPRGVVAVPGDPAGRELALRVPLQASRRRVQTSMSLPPELWAELERLADGGRVDAGTAAECRPSERLSG